MSMVLVCEICGAKLGTFDPKALAIPLTGAMFGPLGPAFTAPFPPSATWEHLYCPICHKRAVGWDLSSPTLVRPDRLLTTDGYLILANDQKQSNADPSVERPHKGKRR